MQDTVYVDYLVNKLYTLHNLDKDELLFLLQNAGEKQIERIKELALDMRIREYGKKVYMRGLIEFTNHCKRNCNYCGIRHDNQKIKRYRLSNEQILACVTLGYEMGYRTFVLQGGEDAYFTDEKIVEIIKLIKKNCPKCAITLSIGEKSFESYKAYYEAGADRYLLRHETASVNLYNELHPYMDFENRMQCLHNLKEIGYEVGTGFIVGLPGQTQAHLVEDLLFLKTFEPHMIGIGPFMPQKDTPLGAYPSGTKDETTLLLAIIRLLLPEVLLPATTSLASVSERGREEGLLAGANVVMPNLSPQEVRGNYALYDGKVYTGAEAACGKSEIITIIQNAGFEVDMGIGSHKSREF